MNQLREITNIRMHLQYTQEEEERLTNISNELDEEVPHMTLEGLVEFTDAFEIELREWSRAVHAVLDDDQATTANAGAIVKQIVKLVNIKANLDHIWNQIFLGQFLVKLNQRTNASE